MSDGKEEGELNAAIAGVSSIIRSSEEQTWVKRNKKQEI